eukprot:1160059-Pelagomonas_calceolata.AAC.10
MPHVWVDSFRECALVQSAHSYLCPGLLGQLGVALVGSWFGFRPGFEAPPMDPKAVESLMYEMDFIGISAYHPLEPDFHPDELQSSIFNVVHGFSSIGIDLNAVLQVPRLTGGGKKEIQYVVCVIMCARHYALAIVHTEFGVGGGASQDGSDLASSPAQMLKTPYWGIQGPYKASKDPWSSKEMRNFLHSFYARVMSWLHEVR